MPTRKEGVGGPLWAAERRRAGITLAVLQTILDPDDPKMTDGEFGRRLAARLGVTYTEGEIQQFRTGRRDFSATVLVAAFELAGKPLDRFARAPTRPEV